MSALLFTEFEFALERQPRLRAVLTFGEAIDLYIAELARRSKSPSTRKSYRRLLNHFANSVRERSPQELTLRDYERFLDRWTDSAPSTLASAISCVKGFSAYLKKAGYVSEHVAESLERPRRQRPEDVEVVSVSQDDVRKMLAACEDMQELLCLGAAVFLGSRRAALARIRMSDVDLVHGTVRTLDKGGKVLVKPIPDEYLQLLRTADRDGLWTSGKDYLIPNRRPASVKREERSDKVVWETVKRVARRAGVEAHVHALRAAFAVAFDEAHPDENFTLQELMGHSSIEVTRVYLRRRDKAKAMEKVRDLSWGLDALSERSLVNEHGAGRGHASEKTRLNRRLSSSQARSESADESSVPSSQAQEAHTGFEPVPLEEALRKRARRKQRLEAPTTSEDAPSS